MSVLSVEANHSAHLVTVPISHMTLAMAHFFLTCQVTHLILSKEASAVSEAAEEDDEDLEDTESDLNISCLSTSDDSLLKVHRQSLRS